MTTLKNYIKSIALPCSSGSLLRFLLLFYTATFLLSAPLSAEVRIACNVSGSRVPMDRTVTYTVTVTWDNDGPAYAFTWPEPPRSTLFEVTGNATASGRTVENGREMASRTFSYTLTPLKTGSAVIEPAAVSYRGREGDSGVLQTVPVTVSIVPAPDSLPWRLITAIMLVLLAAGGTAALVRYVKRRKRAAVPSADGTPAQEPHRPPQQVAEQDMAGLDRLIMNGEQKAYCAGAVKAARRYVETKYRVAFGNGLSPDVLAAARAAQVPEPVVAMLQRILETGDALKFSTADPSRDQLDRLKNYVLELIKTG